MISSTALANAASFAFEGFEKPLILRTNCSEAAWISSRVAAGLKLKRVLMFLHTIFPFESLAVVLHHGCSIVESPAFQRSLPTPWLARKNPTARYPHLTNEERAQQPLIVQSRLMSQ